MKTYQYLIIGGGMTADAAVRGIREVDADGSIGIVTAEPDPPYFRPPLTKSLWTQGKSLDDIWCGTEARGAEITRNTEITGLDPDEKRATDGEGEVYRFDKVLLATGGAPRRLPIGNDHIVYYRTCQDYRKVRAATRGVEHVAVFGGSFIGSEIAAALSINGKRVTMVFPESDIGGRLLPHAFAPGLTRYYETRGISVQSGCKPSRVATRERGYEITVENGVTFEADLLIAGIGIVPNTGLAEACGLKVDNGVVVDAHCRTKHPDVFAAGDAANFHNPALDCRRRVEHEDNALTMGACAGRNMAGETQPYEHLPYFYSDLFDVGYEAVGETDGSLEAITDLGEDPEAKGPIFYLKNGRVRGVVFWNIFGKVDAGRELIAAPGPYDREALRAWSRERLASD